MQTDHNKKGIEDQDKSQVPTDRHFDNFNEDNKPASQQEEGGEQSERQQANEANESSANDNG